MNKGCQPQVLTLPFWGASSSGPQFWLQLLAAVTASLTERGKTPHWDLSGFLSYFHSPSFPMTSRLAAGFCILFRHNYLFTIPNVFALRYIENLKGKL